MKKSSAFFVLNLLALAKDVPAVWQKGTYWCLSNETFIQPLSTHSFFANDWAIHFFIANTNMTSCYSCSSGEVGLFYNSTSTQLLPNSVHVLAVLAAIRLKVVRNALYNFEAVIVTEPICIPYTHRSTSIDCIDVE